jgi:glycosyltransferase involved in cell wall biosynthesis
MTNTQRAPLSVVLITLNAERTLAQTLRSVYQWVDEIVLVDSGSTDNTLAIAQSFGCRILHHHFDGFGAQKQFAVNQATHDWVFLLDADETPDELLQLSIQQVISNSTDNHHCFSLPRNLLFMGKTLHHSGEYNRPVMRVFNRRHAHISHALVHETVVSNGPVTTLAGTLWHDSYGSLHDYVAKMNHYTSLNARQLGQQPRRQGPLDVSVRFAFKFVKVYLFKGGILDGLPGFVWAFFSAVYPVLKYIKLYEQRTKATYPLAAYRVEGIPN